MMLIEHLPDFYKGILEIEKIVDTEESEIRNIKEDLQDVSKQLYINTADWGLFLWEQDLNLPYDSNLTTEERRSRIKSKLRGVGKVDSNLIKNVADAWTNGDVDVSFNDGVVNIKFNSFYGVPTNIDEVKKVIRFTIPAHLDTSYLFTYLLLKDIDNVKTLHELETITLDKFAGGEN